MKRIFVYLSGLFIFFNSCTEVGEETAPAPSFKLSLNTANQLADLPLACISTPFPYKPGHTVVHEYDLQLPQQIHPAFYGCFDWHSAVHGHWSLVYLLKNYPEIEHKDSIIQMLNDHLSPNNLQRELDYFKRNRYTKNFERTYGWAWLLKLAVELHTWDFELARQWYRNIQPLSEYIASRYLDYLPKLLYPIRVGTHSNTAFGLSFAHDYALHFHRDSLRSTIVERAKYFYGNDRACPIAWEPGGTDFLSPCLEEMNIMRRVLDGREFKLWLEDFLPGILSNELNLEPAEVADRSDGGLVHLDGLNFSRAWSLNGLIQTDPDFGYLVSTAEEHFLFSFDKMFDGDYSGEHWLGSFALYAIQSKNEK